MGTAKDGLPRFARNDEAAGVAADGDGLPRFARNDGDVMPEPDGGWPADEFTGVGGSYERDPFTGVRRRVVPPTAVPE